MRRRECFFTEVLLNLLSPFSTATVKILKRDSAANEKIITICIIVAGSRTIENSCGTNRKQSSIPAMFIINTSERYLLSGRLICLKIINPTTVSTSVDAVAISLLLMPNTSPKSASEPTVTVSVRAAGSAFFKLPLKSARLCGFYCFQAQAKTPAVLL